MVPTQLGYDPLLQFVHAEDAVGALEAAVMRPVRGPVNVAGAGSVSLSRLLRLAGKVPLPIPAPLFSAPPSGSAGGSASARLPPEAVPWLRNGLTIDGTRLEEEIGFRPRSTLEAVEDFVEELHGRRVLPGLRTAATGSATDRNGARTRPRPSVTPDRHTAQRERARRLRLDVARSGPTAASRPRNPAAPDAGARRRTADAARAALRLHGRAAERDRARAATSRPRSRAPPARCPNRCAT